MYDGDRPSSPSQQRRLFCSVCDDLRIFKGDDDGKFYCSECGNCSDEVIDTLTSADDVMENGGLYNSHYTRSKPKLENPKPINPVLTIEREILRAVSRGGDGDVKLMSMFDEVSEPRDFGSGVAEAEEVLAEAIRTRYVEGLQVMVERQCEVLVERFGVGAAIVGIVPEVWLKYVAATRVLDDDWADRVVDESEFELKTSKKLKHKPKYWREPLNSQGQRAIYIWFRALRRTLPLYSTLAICFLACHIAREPILPTDIYKWVMEGTLPYLVAFNDMDKFLGLPPAACCFSSKRLFRPTGVIQANQIEGVAASIAQTIGLRLPSVNFYAIAHRYLKELSLPVDNILPHACRLYMWSLPPDLWLSTGYGPPSRVCVMSILIVTIRILYNINGQTTWDMVQSSVENSAPACHKSPTMMDECENVGHSYASESKPANWFPPFCTSDYNAAELLSILEATHDKINTDYEYSKDLLSYLKYCKDIVFAGSTTSHDEKDIIEKLWDMYEKKENDSSEDVKFNPSNVKVEKPNNVASTSSPLDPTVEANRRDYVNNPSSFEKLKLDMEENGFQYLPPRMQQRRGYLHYKRQRIDRMFVPVAHIDYYILLRSCAKVAQVDPQVMHRGVLSLEKRLDWIEQRIDNYSPHQNDDSRNFTGS